MWKEDNITEFKSELNNRLEKEVVAFLNSEKGGDIFIGVTDNGEIIGVEQPDQLQLTISDRIKNNIEPSCLGLYDVYPITKDGKTIIRVIVSRGTEKPYYLKKFGMSPKGCFIRVGSGVQPMNRSMIDTFYASRTHSSLRNIVSPKQELTFEQIKIYYQEKNLSINEAFLKNLDFYTDDGKFNYVAYLLSDNNTLSIKVAKYAGTDKVDLVEKEKDSRYASTLDTTSVTDPVTDSVSDPVKRLLKVIGYEELSPASIRDRLNLKHRHTFRKNYIHPALQLQLIEMTIPEKPKSRNQKYRLTKKGIEIKKLMND